MTIRKLTAERLNAVMQYAVQSHEYTNTIVHMHRNQFSVYTSFSHRFHYRHIVSHFTHAHTHAYTLSGATAKPTKRMSMNVEKRNDSQQQKRVNHGTI